MVFDVMDINGQLDYIYHRFKQYSTYQSIFIKHFKEQFIIPWIYLKEEQF
jgi:hypothetical protein